MSKLTTEQLDGLEELLPSGYRKHCDIIQIRPGQRSGGRRRSKRFGTTKKRGSLRSRMWFEV